MKMGLYSITYRGVWYRGDAIDVFSLLRLAKQQGWEGVELDAERPHAAPMDLSADDRKRLRDLAGELGIELWGETTTVALGRSNDGSWNVRDFPLPVGMMTRASLPERTASITCIWPGRKWRMPSRSAAERKRVRSREVDEGFLDLLMRGVLRGR